MGVKRWLLVVSILAVVVGLIAVLFLQTGADQQIIDSLIPKVESRLGVRITYEDVDVSLTSVSFEGVEVLPPDGEHPFMRFERFGVGVRVGPLLLGELDFTGVRLDGLEVRVGRRARGAEISEWLALVDRAFDPDQGGLDRLLEESGDRTASPPDVHLVSGRAEIDDGRFSLTIDGLSGRFSIAGGAVVSTEAFKLEHEGKRLVAGELAELRYKPESRKASVSLEKPEFELPAKLEAALRLVRDGRDTLAKFGVEVASPLGGEGDAGLPADAGVGGSAEIEDDAEQSGAPMDYRLAINEASGAFVDPEDPDRRTTIDDVTGEIQGGRGQSLSIRARGALPRTDARWVMAASWPPEGNPEITIEAPDIPLGSVGVLGLPRDHMDWDRAS
ncbi:MAG: hypothetical protein JRF63_07475, partial [Deltaproteobacteria bacterium]|nr:hypothetical protein [Deltaproteobacteria bacterium]